LNREGARTKGEVAILVRQNLPHSLLSSFQTKVLECIVISVSSLSSLTPEAVVLSKTSEISEVTFSSLRSHAQAFSFVAIWMLDILLGIVLERIQLGMPSLSAVVTLQFITLYHLPEYL
jgi:hypothetical protein